MHAAFRDSSRRRAWKIGADFSSLLCVIRTGLSRFSSVYPKLKRHRGKRKKIGGGSCGVWRIAGEGERGRGRKFRHAAEAVEFVPYSGLGGGAEIKGKSQADVSARSSRKSIP